MTFPPQSTSATLVAIFTSWSVMYSPCRMMCTPRLQGRQNVLAGCWNIGARLRRFVSGANQFQCAGLGVGQHALAVHGDVVGFMQEAQTARFVSRSRNLAGSDGLEGFLHGLHEFDGLAASSGRIDRGAIHRAQQHLLAAAAAGQQTDADFDQSDVEFGVRLAGGSVQRDLAVPPPRHSPKGATTTGLGENLMACVMPWNWRMARSTSSHSSSWTDMSSSMRLAPTEKLSRVVGDDERVEVIAGAARLQGLRDKPDDVAADRVHLGMEFDAGDAVAQVDQRRAGILLDHAVGFLRDLDRPHAWRKLSLVHTCRFRDPNTCGPSAVWDRPRTRTSCPEASSFSTFGGTGCSSFFMRATVASTPAASHSSKGPSSQLKPRRMARSISTIESEISGIRLAE